MAEVLRQETFNTKNVEERVAEMLKDGYLTPEERKEILGVWHEFRKSKDKTILKAREQLRELAIKNGYEGLARRLYTDSWTGSHNETPEKEKKRLSKARSRVKNVKNIDSLSDEENDQARAIELLNNSLRQTSEELRQANDTLTKKESAKNSINEQEIKDKKTAFDNASTALSNANGKIEALKKKQEEYDSATDDIKKTLEGGLNTARITAQEFTKEKIDELTRTKNEAEQKYKEALKEKNRIISEFNTARTNRDNLQGDLDSTLAMREAASNELLKAKEGKTQAQAKEKKSQNQEVSDAEIKDKEQAQLQAKRDEEKKKAEEVTQE